MIFTGVDVSALSGREHDDGDVADQRNLRHPSMPSGALMLDIRNPLTPSLRPGPWRSRFGAGLRLVNWRVPKN